MKAIVRQVAVVCFSLLAVAMSAVPVRADLAYILIHEMSKDLGGSAMKTRLVLGGYIFIVAGTSGQCGGLYFLSQDTFQITKLHQFSASDPLGCNPTDLNVDIVSGGYFVTTDKGVVVFDTSGNALGSAGMPPGNPVGTSAQATPPGARLTGFNPPSTIANLFITTSNSSDSAFGAIYQSNLHSDSSISTPRLIFKFSGGKHGSYPTSPAIVGADGNLYGVASGGGSTHHPQCQPANAVNGCGIVYRLRPVVTGGKTKWQEDTLYEFSGGKDGGQPNTELQIDADGNLYGTTYIGGDLTSATAVACVGPAFHFVFGCGTVFMLTNSATLPWQETVLHAFHGAADGAQPFGPVALDGTGKVYGTTIAGGNTTADNCTSSALRNLTAGCGVVFQLHKNGMGKWVQSILFSFDDVDNAGQPTGPLTLDGSGDVFGSTWAGGDLDPPCDFGSDLGWAAGCGVLYELTPTPPARH